MSPPWAAITGAGQVHQQVFGLWTCWEAFVSLHTQRPVEHTWVFNFSVSFFSIRSPVEFSLLLMCLFMCVHRSWYVPDWGSCWHRLQFVSQTVLEKVAQIRRGNLVVTLHGYLIFVVLSFFLTKPICFASRVTLGRCICMCMTRKMTTRESGLLWRN